jgi:cob(I)alamin adenosyltransferase
MVNLTRIYTRTGDDGSTALGDMTRTVKTDPRLEAYADVDEANSAIGVALALGELSDDVRTLLTRVQNELFDVGADLCTPVVPEPEYPPRSLQRDPHGTPFLHPAWRHAGGRSAPCRAHRGTPR